MDIGMKVIQINNLSKYDDLQYHQRGKYNTV